MCGYINCVCPFVVNDEREQHRGYFNTPLTTSNLYKKHHLVAPKRNNNLENPHSQMKK